jgi:hypothetical protein
MNTQLGATVRDAEQGNAAHFTARVSGADMPLGHFRSAEDAQLFAEQFLCRGNADNAGLIGTLEFVFLTAGAG